jgi:hypothetical protein
MSPLERIYDNNELLDMLQDDDTASVEETIDNLPDPDLETLFSHTLDLLKMVSDARQHRATVQGATK